MQVSKMVLLNVRTEPLLPASGLYFLVPIYLSSSGPMLSIMSSESEMHCHIEINLRRLFFYLQERRIILRSFEPLVVGSMSVLLVFVPSVLKVKLGKASSLAMYLTRIVSFCGMMKVVVASKLPRMLNLMKGLMICLLKFYLRIVSMSDD